MDADDLYGLPLDEFVAARGALAKELRKVGQRDDAAEVAARRRPSVAAWAVNQIVRTQRPATKKLFDAGDELRAAQSDLLAGRGDGRALRAAGDRERAAVEELVERARGLLSSAGNELSAGVIDRVSDTLHAAALDEDAREQVRDGRLERELRHVGLGFGLGAGTAPDLAPRTRSTAKEPKGGAGAERASEMESGGAGADRASEKESGGARKAASGGSSGAGKTEAADSRASRGGKAEAAEATQTAAARKRTEPERVAAERAETERVRRERVAARRDARAAHATAKRRADAASRALRAAEDRHDQAEQALREADEALTAARGDAASADDALQSAQAELDAAQRTS